MKSTNSGADAATPMNLLQSRPSTIAARNTRPRKRKQQHQNRAEKKEGAVRQESKAGKRASEGERTDPRWGAWRGARGKGIAVAPSPRRAARRSRGRMTRARTTAPPMATTTTSAAGGAPSPACSSPRETTYYYYSAAAASPVPGPSRRAAGGSGDPAGLRRGAAPISTGPTRWEREWGKESGGGARRISGRGGERGEERAAAFRRTCAVRGSKQQTVEGGMVSSLNSVTR